MDIIGHWKLLQSKRQETGNTEKNTCRTVKNCWPRKFLLKAKLKANVLRGIFKSGTKHRNESEILDDHRGSERIPFHTMLRRKI